MPKEYLTPSEIKELRFYNDIPLENGLRRFEKNENSFQVEGRFKCETGKPVLMRLEGELNTDGIQVGNWKMVTKKGEEKEGQNYFFNIDLNTEKDEEALDAIADSMDSFLKENSDVDGFDEEEWTVVPLHDAGKMRIKLAFTGSKFDARINGTKWAPSQVDHINQTVAIDTPVTVFVEVQPYCKFAEKKAGYNLIVRKVNFDVPLEAPIFATPAKKRKTVTPPKSANTVNEVEVD